MCFLYLALLHSFKYEVKRQMKSQRGSRHIHSKKISSRPFQIYAPSAAALANLQLYPAKQQVAGELHLHTFQHDASQHF